MEQQATITELTLFITMILCVVTLVVPRKYILFPYVIAACWIPADQTVMVGELNFQVLRILIVVGILRLWLRGEIVPVRWNRFDKLILAWALVGAAIYIVQWMSLGAVLFCCGRLLQWLGMYWVFRQTVQSWDDLRFAHVALAVCAIAMLPFVILEWSRGSNPFALLGRVHTNLREGSFRCMATFPHAIIMGLFWTALVPLFVGFARQGRHRGLFWTAIGAITFMVWSSASSTPILALALVPVLLFVYPWRHNTRLVAWGVVAMLCALHIVMKAPVWNLVARVGVVSGSTGYHRYRLIDQAIRHFPEWALLGSRGTSHWGQGLQDVTNQYILEGVTGGLATLILFCAVHYVGARMLVRMSLQTRDKGGNCVAIDLLGQQSAGFYKGRPISNTGGFMQFIGFCGQSKGGRGVTALTSRNKHGQSRILPFLPEGSVVDLPAQLAHYVCTEYEIVNLRGLNGYERVEALISIAHPDDRLALEQAAHAHGMLAPCFPVSMLPEEGGARRYPSYEERRDYKTPFNSSLWGYDWDPIQSGK